MKNLIHLKIWLLSLTLIFIHQFIWSQNTSILKFDGDDFLKINDVNDKLDVAGGDYTIELWFRSDPALSFGEKRILLSRKGSFEIRMEKVYQNVETVVFETLETGGFVQRWELSGSINDANRWHHVAVSSDITGGTRTTRFFIDGELIPPESTDPRLNPWANNEPIYIGKRDDVNNPSYFQGYMDEIHFQNGARYSAAFAKNIVYPPDSKMVSTIFLYDFDENTGTSIHNNDDTDFDISFQSSPHDVSWLGWRGNVADQGLPLKRTFIWRGFYSSSSGYDPNWDPGVKPLTGDNVIIAGYATNDYQLGEEGGAAYGSMEIEAGAKAILLSSLTVSDMLIENTGILELNYLLTVTNSFVNLGGAPGFEIKSSGSCSGSLITDQEGVVAIYERNIDPYNPSVPGSGRHLISSPVGSFEIAPSTFAPGTNDDFYSYDPIANMWLNYKQGHFDSMSKGFGYSIAYENFYMHYYPPQAINVKDVSYTNLINTSGWALLGNPFSSAIDWTQGTWSRSNISGPQVYNEDMKNYEPATVIPATNGFWVQVTNATNHITLPADARVHQMCWYKKDKTAAHQLILKFIGDEEKGWDKTTISFDESYTNGFDEDADFNKMRSNEVTPQILTLNSNNEEFNTLAIPVPSAEKVIPLNVNIGYDGIYKIEILENTTQFESPIYLKDLKTGDLINLSSSSEYSFVGTKGESEDRFLLYFNSAVGIEEVGLNNSLLIYTNGQSLFINSNQKLNSEAFIYDLSGRMVHSFYINGKKHQENTALSKGAYILKTMSENKELSQKFIIH